MALEIEVKFLIADLPALRHRLLNTGAAIARQRVLERNVRFDNAWDGLARKGQLLRLRQDGGVRLTFKGLAPEDAFSEAKIREELEVTLDDFAIAAQLIERIGFEPRQVYEKYRETFHVGDVEVVLDELPFGDFVELEGAETALKHVAAQLALDWERRILPNYLALMGQMQAAFELPFQDLTFANFAAVPHRARDLFEPADIAV